MPAHPDPQSLDFLKSPPTAVASQAQAQPDPADLLPQAVANHLLSLEGVGGVWIERNASGQREVVIHLSRRGTAPHIPRKVHGMPTRIVGGEPIRAF